LTITPAVIPDSVLESPPKTIVSAPLPDALLMLKGDAMLRTAMLSTPLPLLKVVPWLAGVPAIIFTKGGGAWLDYVFEDKADTIDKVSAQPCNFNQDDWSNASNTLDQYIGQPPIIYNSLGHTSVVGGKPQVAPSMALNATSAGGESEDCYAQADNTLRTKLAWQGEELTEIDMAADGKYFVCNGTMVQPAGSSIAQRIYQYASYLLTYNPNLTLYETNFTTYSGLKVYPEEELVALQPLAPQPTDPSQLLQSGGAYAREYQACYFATVYVGPCAAVVDSNQSGMSNVPFPWPSKYHHTLYITGSGVLDGGAAYTNGPAPPSTMSSGTALIAFP